MTTEFIDRRRRLKCDVCSFPIGDTEEASIYVEDYGGAIDRFNAAADRNSKLSDTGMSMGEFRVYSMSELGRREKEEQEWKVVHDSCHLPSSSDYWIGFDRLRDWRSVVSWTAHMFPKDWFHYTDWWRFLSQLLHGEDKHEED